MLTELVWAWFCDSVPHILLYFVLLPAPSVSLHDTAQSVPSVWKTALESVRCSHLVVNCSSYFCLLCSKVQ